MGSNAESILQSLDRLAKLNEEPNWHTYNYFVQFFFTRDEIKLTPKQAKDILDVLFKSNAYASPIVHDMNQELFSSKLKLNKIQIKSILKTMVETDLGRDLVFNLLPIKGLPLLREDMCKILNIFKPFQRRELYSQLLQEMSGDWD